MINVKRKFIFPAAMCLSAAILFSSIPASTDSGYAVYAAEKALLKRGCLLAGRYGKWEYSFMEKSLLQGLEIAEKLV